MKICRHCKKNFLLPKDKPLQIFCDVRCYRVAKKNGELTGKFLPGNERVLVRLQCEQCSSVKWRRLEVRIVPYTKHCSRKCRDRAHHIREAAIRKGLPVEPVNIKPKDIGYIGVPQEIEFAKWVTTGAEHYRYVRP